MKTYTQLFIAAAFMMIFVHPSTHDIIKYKVIDPKHVNKEKAHLMLANNDFNFADYIFREGETKKGLIVFQVGWN